jgi:glycosyltransferase involved in cell wall biosynthesis
MQQGEGRSGASSVLDGSPDHGPLDGSGFRVLVVHGRYRTEGASGENEVVDDEVRLLGEFGCDVEQIELQSDDIAEWSPWKKATLPGRVVWSRAGQATLRRAIELHRPSIIHVHNTFPLFSPAAFRTARASGAAVVHTLHNFRPLCPVGTFLRDGRACEDCLGKTFPVPAVRHGCYRGSRLATLPIATMDAVHGHLQTWQRCVDRFIVLSDYEKDKYIAAGWPAAKFRIKYNTVWESAFPPRQPGPAFLCMSRIVPEKGVDVLLEGWRRAFPDGSPPLHLTASGESAAELQAKYGSLPGVTFLGHVERSVLLDEVTRSKAIIVPSRCYEGFPRVVVEAYAAGVPVVASRVGSLTELIEDGVTGLQVEMGDPDDMARALRRLADSDELCEQLSRGARHRYESLYSPEKTMAELFTIYRDAIAERDRRLGTS